MVSLDFDKCKETPIGVIVDEYGCSKDNDTDGDGITDKLDQCKETPMNIDYIDWESYHAKTHNTLKRLNIKLIRKM